MTLSVYLETNYIALGFFILFAFLFVGLVGMYLYSLKLKKKVKTSANQFSHNLKATLDKMTTPEAKLIYLDQTAERIKNEKSYDKNPEGRKLLLSKVYQHKASILHKASNPQEVIKACGQIIEVEPSHIQSYLNRGAMYGQIGEYKKGIEDLNQAELLDSKNPNIYNNRGWMYLQLNQYDKALSDLDHAISILPTSVEYFNRGNVYKAQGDLQKALEDYKMSLSLNPNSELNTLLTDSIVEVENNVKISNQE